MDMTKPEKSWDDNLKVLVDASPQAFVDWLLGKGQFIERLPYKLKTWKLEVDSLLKVGYEGNEVLLHIEFQTYHDTTMAERVLRYNVLSQREYRRSELATKEVA